MANEYIYSFFHLRFYYPIQYAKQYVLNHNKTMLLPSSPNFPCLLIVFLCKILFIICTNFKTDLQYEMYFYYCWTRKILKCITRNGSTEWLYSVQICKSSADTTTTKAFSKKSISKDIGFFSLAEPLEKKRATHSVRSLYVYF